MAAEETLPDVIVERTGSLGRLRLNRPRAMNSLTRDMVHLIAPALDAFEKDAAITAVLLTGEGERGLCAGGDIRALYEGERTPDGTGAKFWRDEYRVNARIARFPKPYLAVMDGITMGGGIGLSAHGTHRIVTERSRIAMPEVGIGFVPDVGGTWLLAHAPGEIGTYLALTGETIGPADAVYAGLADLQIPQGCIPVLIDELAQLTPGTGNEAVRALLARHAVQPEPARLAEHRALIDQCFAGSSVEAILQALEADGTQFALKTRDVIASKSPTSLKLTFRLIRLARQADGLEEALEREFAAAVAVAQGHDFYEGVRAAIIDKDRNPRWSPPSLAEVDDRDIEAWIQPVADRVFA
ncbi:enoyl-CoA hydratase/isomerase family protein [Labrys sp. ZIDIC5]|uniref:enoyl-CoA hydratase/isomerase family protein n=1 Tax=Labrys sedimenti TaxID=3106036 RepID=UPI002ACA0E05|nr:enoyl-CoA hydratase/isomerase family protein [Labrys sp. ZIDIC5]MDZ5450019.1 enoyl-CoA hydratase/isomerase family protein [Labrys sp. ZIDIC5]